MLFERAEPREPERPSPAPPEKMHGKDWGSLNRREFDAAEQEPREELRRRALGWDVTIAETLPRTV
jgi:hypothetical protein